MYCRLELIPLASRGESELGQRPQNQGLVPRPFTLAWKFPRLITSIGYQSIFRGGPLEIPGGGAKNFQCMNFFSVKVGCRNFFSHVEGLHEFFFYFFKFCYVNFEHVLITDVGLLEP